MVCGLYVDEMPILEWYMATLVVMNGHENRIDSPTQEIKEP